MREVIFDTETTGLEAKKGDRIIEIGGVELINRFQTGRTFHYLLNPEGREIHPDAVRIHGITNDDLHDKPTFAEIFDEFNDFFGNATLVAHNASFDVEFINAELARINKKPIEHEKIIDTLLIARRKHVGVSNSLDALCSRYGIEKSHRTKHGALLDAQLLVEVYIELLGGKQAMLDFTFSNKVIGKQKTELVKNNILQNKKRLKPLSKRLTEQDIKRHLEFIKSLGEHAIWNKTGVSR